VVTLSAAPAVFLWLPWKMLLELHQILYDDLIIFQSIFRLSLPHSTEKQITFHKPYTVTP